MFFWLQIHGQYMHTNGRRPMAPAQKSTQNSYLSISCNQNTSYEFKQQFYIHVFVQCLQDIVRMYEIILLFLLAILLQCLGSGTEWAIIAFFSFYLSRRFWSWLRKFFTTIAKARHLLTQTQTIQQSLVHKSCHFEFY